MGQQHRVDPLAVLTVPNVLDVFDGSFSMFARISNARISTAYILATATVALAIAIPTPTFAQKPAAPTAVNAPAEPPAMQPAEKAGIADVKGAIKMSKVVFVEPKDGATVPTTFTVKFGVEGMKIANAGTMTPGTGHHHLIVDGAPIKQGQAVPTDATHLHFGKGQTETKLTLKPGAHTLTLQFADGTHLSYGEMMSQTIHITVK